MASRSLQFPCRNRALDYSDRTLLMGVLNVTPDSFSDGGLFLDADAAIARAHRMIEEGADIIDIGGESSRPGADPVSEEEELRRVLPVVEALSEMDIPLSIDTYKPAVAQACLDRGAAFVNDISGLRNPAMVETVAAAGAAVCIMHMKGTPRTMQKHPQYEDVVEEVLEFLSRQAGNAERAGIPHDAIVIDPGIGFGKTLEDNLTLLRSLDRFAGLGYALLVGTSRKSFIGRILDDAPESERLEGTAASVAVAIAYGANLVRVHDVAFMAKLARVADRIVHG